MKHPHRLCLLLLLAMTPGLYGCGGNARERYLPDESKARNALQLALETWKSGAAHAPITSSKPVINVFDARWQSGRKLESFEILEKSGNADQPQFTVRLKLAGEPEETNTFLIIGIDPLQVFRDEDYKRTESM